VDVNSALRLNGPSVDLNCREPADSLGGKNICKHILACNVRLFIFEFDNDDAIVLQTVAVAVKLKTWSWDGQQRQLSCCKNSLLFMSRNDSRDRTALDAPKRNSLC